MVDNSHNNGKISRRAIFLFPTDNLVYNDHCLLTVREKQEDSKKATFHICCARTIFQRHFLSVQAIQRPCRTICPAYFTFIFDSINYSLRTRVLLSNIYRFEIPFLTMYLVKKLFGLSEGGGGALSPWRSRILSFCDLCPYLCVHTEGLDRRVHPVRKSGCTRLSRLRRLNLSAEFISIT